ncbi:MAG: hypothetical protein FWH57_13150 [Oscillospiraceae bacterium]|nr:hypothetical protein [Oscillospiraceae bacterium]
MKTKIALSTAIFSLFALLSKITAYAMIIHSNVSNQDLGLADLSGESYMITVVGGENFWIIGAMIATAIVLMLIDKAKEKKEKGGSGNA